MAGRGKGYFWEGLSQGIRGLYGQVSNERMATQAQGAQSKEHALNRAQSAAQFSQLLPSKDKDEFPQEFGTVEEAARAADTNAAKSAAALQAAQYSDDSVKAAAAQAHAANIRKQQEAQTALSAFRAKAASRHGVSVPPVAPAPKSKKQQVLEDIFKD